MPLIVQAFHFPVEIMHLSGGILHKFSEHNRNTYSGKEEISRPALSSCTGFPQDIALGIGINRASHHKQMIRQAIDISHGLRIEGHAI